MLGITDYLWRLVPGNPILRRVVESGGKRTRDMFFRCGYLGVLIVVACFSLMSGSGEYGTASLAGLAKVSDALFQRMAYCQLGLVALLAPIFTAGAITQEKDAQTYDILLSTPLTNAQIVLGSLLSRIFFILALLVSGIPIFSITQVFGGVAIGSIAMSFGIAAATACVTGAMAMAIATFKVGTRRTIFSFYLVIVMYLAGVWFLDSTGYFNFRYSPDGLTPTISKTSWLTGIHPFLALRVIFDPSYRPPELASLPANLRTWPIGEYLSSPHTAYMKLMFLMSLLLVTPSILLLRKTAQSSTSLRAWVLQKLRIKRGDRTQKPRSVWSNPIAWREARTKASAARAVLLRYGFMVLGVGGALALAWMYSSERLPSADAARGEVVGANGGIGNLVVTDRNSKRTYMVNTDTRLTYKGMSVSLNDVPRLVVVRSYDVDPASQGNRLAAAELLPRPRYVSAATYDAGSQTLKILDDDRVLGPFNVKDASVQLDGRTFDLSQMRGRYVVEDYALNAVDHRAINTLMLGEIPRVLPLPMTRRSLLGAVMVEFAIILLIVTNAAASTVTREKEDGTLDLLLSTPITSRYYIWGKLRGLVSFVLPLAAVPVLSVIFFVIHDVFAGIGQAQFTWTVYPEAVLIMPATLIMVSAFAVMLGMHLSLRCRTTVWAVMSSIGIITALCAASGFCGYGLLARGDTTVAHVLGSFSPFTLIEMLLNPAAAAQHDYYGNGVTDEASRRVAMFIFGYIAAAAYAGIVWWMYKSMVRNFDMTIRRQSR